MANSNDTPSDYQVQRTAEGGIEQPSGTAARRPPPLLPSWAKIVILVGLVLLASVGYLSSIFRHSDDSSKNESVEEMEEQAARKSAGEFDLTDAEGRKHPIKEFEGDVIILSFWASWCAPCLVELPTFAELAKRFKDRGFKIVPVNVDEANVGKGFAREFWQKNGFDFPGYFDATKAVASRFGVDMLPANFVLDRHGRIVFSGFGDNDWANEQTMEIIEGLLDEK